MARPSSFDEAKPRKAKRGKVTDKGKLFERQLRRGLELCRPYGWTERFPDKLVVGPGGKMIPGKGTESPPDLIHLEGGCNMLIECKAVLYRYEKGAKDNNTSIAFDRLGDHQFDSLFRFDQLSPQHYGFVAVCWRNEQLGSKRIYRAWLISINMWNDWESLLGRKSIPFEMFLVKCQAWGMAYHTDSHGGHFDPTPVINQLKRGTA